MNRDMTIEEFEKEFPSLKEKTMESDWGDYTIFISDIVKYTRDIQKIKDVFQRRININNQEITTVSEFIKSEVEYCRTHDKNYHLESGVPQAQTEKLSLEYLNKFFIDILKELEIE